MGLKITPKQSLNKVLDEITGDFDKERLVEKRLENFAKVSAYLYFKLDNNDAYIVHSYFYIPAENGKALANWEAKEKELIDGMEKKFRQDFLNNLRVRQEFEVPNRYGICLIGGFIADDGKKPFTAHTTVEFAKQHDVSLEIMHGDELKKGEPTLLQRDIAPEKSALVKIFKITGYRTIRQGPRTINGMSGTEKLIKWDGNKYMLIWERDGGNPRIMMQFGTERKTERSAAKPKSSLSGIPCCQR